MDTANLKQKLVALFKRVKLVITQPQACWDTIAAERLTSREILSSILFPMLLLGAVCSFQGMQLFGLHNSDLGHWHRPFFEDLRRNILSIILSVGSIFLGARAIARLAREFGGQQDLDRAFSLLAHVALPAITARSIGLFPQLAYSLSFFVLISLVTLFYTIYLVYQGAHKMLCAPEQQRLALTAAILVVILLLSALTGILTTLLAPVTEPWTLPL